MGPSPPPDLIDPDAVDALFESVVFGDGLIDEAQVRREAAEQRRREAEERAEANAAKRAEVERDRALFETLVHLGPDRPAPAPPDPTPPSASRPSSSFRLQIQFTATDRSRVPRKTRQQWLDKFGAACDAAFPGAIAGGELNGAVLSLEQGVYQTAKTSTGYIGSWMNRIHALKKAPSLSAFLSPSTATTVASLSTTSPTATKNKSQDEIMADDAETSRDEAMADDAETTIGTVVTGEESLTSRTGSSAKKNPCLLGEELPFNLFGSDDDESIEAIACFPGSTTKMTMTDPGSADMIGYILRNIIDNVLAASEEVPSNSSLTTPTVAVPPKKRRKKDDADLTSSSKKAFLKQCQRFVSDVVATHLRLRFGSELGASLTTAVRDRIVAKVISSEAKWSRADSLARLRRHKVAIDQLAEQYARRIIEPDTSSSDRSVHKPY